MASKSPDRFPSLTFVYPSIATASQPSQYKFQGYYFDDPEGRSGPAVPYTIFLARGQQGGPVYNPAFGDEYWPMTVDVSTTTTDGTKFVATASLPANTVLNSGTYILQWTFTRQLSPNDVPENTSSYPYIEDLAANYTIQIVPHDPDAPKDDPAYSHANNYILTLGSPNTNVSLSLARVGAPTGNPTSTKTITNWAPIATTILLGAIMIILLVAVCLYFTRT